MSDEPVKPAIACCDDDFMPFGKHAGIPMDMVDPGYFKWLVKQPWLRESRSRLFWWCVLNSDKFSDDEEVYGMLCAAYDEVGEGNIVTQPTYSGPKQPFAVAGMQDMIGVVTDLIDLVVNLSQDELISKAYPDPSYRRAVEALKPLRAVLVPGTFENNWRVLDSEGRGQLLRTVMLRRAIPKPAPGKDAKRNMMPDLRPDELYHPNTGDGDLGF